MGKANFIFCWTTENLMKDIIATSQSLCLKEYQYCSLGSTIITNSTDKSREILKLCKLLELAVLSQNAKKCYQVCSSRCIEIIVMKYWKEKFF